MKNIQNTNAAAILAVAISAVLMSFILMPIITNGDTDKAISYLKTKTEGSWSSIARVAYGETPDVSYLKATDAATAIGLEAPIMAIAAAGENPRTYPNTDLVAALKGFYSNGQIGDSSTLNDDIFGVLALVSAGEQISSVAISETKQFIIHNQNSDGGWGFAVGGTSDTNTTAAAIQALISAGVDEGDVSVTNALAYLKASQNDDGGFPYDPQSAWGTDSDASSDAWVISALNAVSIDPATWNKGSNTPLSHLLSLQDESGFFAYQAGGAEDSFSSVTTAYAAIALTGASLPVVEYSPVVPEVSFRIEGSAGTVCVGETYATDALEVVRDATGICDFSYIIDQLSFGPYLSQIGNDTAEGLLGWLYRVNFESPSVGAADYVLQAGDEVLWYYGDFEWVPLRLSLSDIELSSDETNTTATVEEYTSTSWRAVEGATVLSGSTDSQGVITLSPENGVYQVYAEKDGYIRSNTVQLVVGDQVEQSVGLSAIIGGGNPGFGDNGDDQSVGTISFSVNPNDLSFGAIEPGSSAQDTVIISNDGDGMISVRSDVTGDDVFRQNIKLDTVGWRSWSVELAQGNEHETQVDLYVPTSYVGTGTKQGDLIFWAVGGTQ